MDYPTSRVPRRPRAAPVAPGAQWRRIRPANSRSISRAWTRYITLLQNLGIPVEGGPGRHGGYQLRPGARLPPLLFNEAEALAIAVGLLAVRQFRLMGTPAGVESALAKVERVLPTALREQTQAVAKHLVFSPRPASAPPAGATVLTLSEAVEGQRRVWFRYTGWRGEATERQLDPYGVVWASGRWYLVGWCHLRAAVRVFRVDRVAAVAVLPQTFSRPADFDSARHVAQSLALVPYPWLVEVQLETTLVDAEQRLPAGSAGATGDGGAVHQPRRKPRLGGAPADRPRMPLRGPRAARTARGPAAGRPDSRQVCQAAPKPG